MYAELQDRWTYTHVLFMDAVQKHSGRHALREMDLPNLPRQPRATSAAEEDLSAPWVLVRPPHPGASRMFPVRSGQLLIEPNVPSTCGLTSTEHALLCRQPTGSSPLKAPWIGALSPRSPCLRRRQHRVTLTPQCLHDLPVLLACRSLQFGKDQTTISAAVYALQLRPTIGPLNSVFLHALQHRRLGYFGSR